MIFNFFKLCCDLTDSKYLLNSFQQMRRSSNREENKRIIMDLDVVMKSHDCPYIVQCIGIFITTVSISLALINLVHLLKKKTKNWGNNFCT